MDDAFLKSHLQNLHMYSGVSVLRCLHAVIHRSKISKNTATIFAGEKKIPILIYFKFSEKHYKLVITSKISAKRTD